MDPLHRDLYTAGIQQPLLFINSSNVFQTAESVLDMMKLVKPADNHGVSRCHILTLRYT